ncbi:GNAT family N-acetyltransferase [Bacillus mangrovi]|uniref:GNAT family N-acetyltransferase n=1 Tax=Metabacillus mangrovi TaxID=1491830 RepID=A0A7X2S3S9_9BACI|nr:GNAT family protein [Metabacillus mangrovi]MTH53169.1 GNAT family N-acetyltransferase [Metabacillus mangrovi]
MTFPELRTERLFLRKVADEDAAALLDIFSRKNVLEYYGMEPLKERAEAVLLASKFREGWESGSSIRWGLEYDSRLIGTIGYHNWSKIHKRAEIGYELHPDFWRMGFASEALHAAADFGFRTLGLHRIGATVRPENIASLKLLEKMGFRQEGLLHGYQYTGGSFFDLIMLSLIKENGRNGL